jgi:L-proline amide hydrolase
VQTFPTTEGFIPIHGYRTWYRIVGNGEEPGKLPLLALHGGPGASHDYLEPLEAMANTGRRVIFYDQLGGGNSDHPHNPSLWTVELFLEELDAVRKALALERLHLLGQSWGGMLGMEYALTQPDGLVSLTVADSPASIPHWVGEANRLRAQLPPEVQHTLLQHEQQGTTDSEEYQDTMLVFYRRHVCRVDPWPDCVMRTFDKLVQYPEVYNTMNGPSEFYVIGTLKTWDITERLHEINVPTLLLSGRYDEATPSIVETIHRSIPGSEWIIFENSSHMPHVEETDLYIQALSRFLTRVEANDH